MDAGKLTVITGPMFAGKTSLLMDMVEDAQKAGKSVVVIKHAVDDRYDRESVVTHNGRRLKAFRCYTLAEILDQTASYQVIAIDEGQFFNDLTFVVNTQVNSGQEVIVAGLNSGNDRKPFSQMAELVMTAERAIHLSSKCACGRDAVFTLRYNYDNPRQFVGGSDMYRSTCRTCYFDSKLGA